MLTGIDPALTGELLFHLDSMGHSDSVVLADAHFPAARIGDRWIDIPLIGTPRMMKAIRGVVPLDISPAVELMESAAGVLLPVQRELLDSAGIDLAEARLVDRFSFYESAAKAYLVIRTGETRFYGNALLRKGLVVTPEISAAGSS